jgi:hypothetical protein
MAIEMPNGEQIRALSQYDSCFLTSSPLERSLYGNPILEVDHVFPSLASRKYPKVITDNKRNGILESYENKTRVCSNCHDKIDDKKSSKIRAFRDYNLAGLIEWNAVYYPRPLDDTFFEIMQLQWRVLFMRVRDNLRALKGNYPPHLMQDYSTSLAIAEFHVDQWEAGYFHRQTPGFKGLQLAS